MEKVILDDLPENSLFHFTHKDSIEEIEKNGLKPVIGANANGIEETPKIFFSKGELGIIKVTEVWLRWLMNRIYGVNDRLGMYKNLTEEENKERISKWTKEFLSKNYLNDPEKKDKLFEYVYNYFKERTYLQLDIKDGIEYNSNDKDENKVKLSSDSEKISFAYAKIMYGEFSDINNPIMDDWNMHTKSNVGVDKSKIKQVTTKDGKTDMLSIVIQLYDKYKNMPHNKFLLDEFIEYSKKKEELNNMVNEEGNKYDQVNNSRFY